MLVINGIEYVKKETVTKNCSYEVNKVLDYPQRDFISIPNNIDGMPVKRILNSAFFWKHNLEKYSTWEKYRTY